MGERLTVRSADGTELSVARSGSGTPIVLVHGTCGQPQDYAFLSPVLQQRHEVWTYARRGRGLSGDTEPYALAREVEDLHAVLGAADRPAHVFGHSYGGALAVLAAPDADLLGLILYEPALRTDRVDVAARERSHAAVVSGDLDAALDGFAVLAGISDDEMAMIRSVPVAYEGMQRSALTGPREAEALDGLDPARWRDRAIDAPALVLSGELTPVAIYAGQEDLAPVLPNGQFQTVPGQRHLGPVFAAQDVGRRIVEFTAAAEA